MKIVQINSVLDIGSTGFLVQNISNAISDAGYTSYIAYGRGRKIQDNTIKIGGMIDFYSSVLQTRILDNHGFSSINATKELIERLIKISPDIIHLHNLHGYYVNIKYLFDYIKEYNVKVVWTLHDCWAFTGHCAYYDMVSCDKWKTHCYSCENKKVYPSSLLFDSSSKNFNDKKEIFCNVKNLSIVTPSKWLASEVKMSFLKNYNVSVISNGIATNNPIKKENKKQKKNIILGVASVWDDRKGFNDFLKLSTLIDSDTKIVMVGLTNKQISILPDNIEGHPKIYDREELMKFFQQATIFFNPTREETFGLVNVESLSCGVPVVTYDSGGSPETIDDTCGIVVPKGDINLAHKAILKLLRHKISEKMCIDFAKTFSINVMTNNYINLYRRLSRC